MSTLVLETDGTPSIEAVVATINEHNLAATLHWTDKMRRIVLPVDGEFEDREYIGLVRTMADVFGLYFNPHSKDPTSLPDGKTREFEGKTFSVDDLREIGKTGKDKDEGQPDVPSGIDLMGPAGAKEIGDVRASDDLPGFIGSYLSDSARGLERLAGVVGQVVVRQNDGFWVRSPNGSWSATTQGAAIGRVKSIWRGVLATHGVRCKPRHIEELFRRSLLPVVDGTLTSPVGADFVEYRGRVYLNMRLAPRLEPTALGEDGQLLREFVLRSVLNDQRPIEQIEAELGDVKVRTSTRWGLHWIAHLYQRPGIALSTALWLVGVEQGVGKSLFGSLLADLVGARNAVNAEQCEMTGEWSDWQAGRSLIIADEINVIEKKTFYAKQKSWIGSRSISIRRRGVGTWEIPSIANWLFLTNDLQPIRIDGADRRNMLIETTNDRAQAKAMIARLKPILDDPARRRAALAEFGAWLDTIVIDDDLISRAIQTQLKDDLIESTRDPVESFVLEQVESDAWNPELWLSTDELMQRYFAWCDHTEAFRGYKSRTHLVNGLKRLRVLGWVDDKRTKKARGWVLKNPPMAEPVMPLEEGATVIDFFRNDPVKPTMLQTMLRKRAERQGMH